LIALMVLGGLMLWLGNPVIWLWIGSHTTGSQQGRMGPYVLVAFGILVSTVIVSIGLARLNRIYQSVTGHVSTVRVRLPWMRSLRGEEDARDGARLRTGLDRRLGGGDVPVLVLRARRLVAARLLTPSGSSCPRARR
jgi:hypothetical protein